MHKPNKTGGEDVKIVRKMKIVRMVNTTKIWYEKLVIKAKGQNYKNSLFSPTIGKATVSIFEI